MKRSSTTSSRGAKKDAPIARRVLATNRKARHNYVIESVIEAGLRLVGSEVKSLRDQNPTITDGYARIQGEELWLHGVFIPPLAQAARFGHEPTRRRKCLVHKRELRKLQRLLEADGRTLVALSIYFKGPHVKVELGVGRGRRKGDRRQREREKSDRRQIRRAENEGRR